MLTSRIRIKVAAFLLVGLTAVAYVAGRYVGLFGTGGYTVTMRLVDAGGIFTNAEVTYRGVPVGRVGPLDLTDDGVDVELDLIQYGIPADVDAVVADRSAVGEQYVDLKPRKPDGPTLHQGSVIPQSATKTPLPVQTLLTNIDSLVASVPADSLHTLVDELDTATRGATPDLQTLLDSTHSFVDATTQHLPQLTQLVTDSATVLKTQNDESAALTQFGANARLIAEQLDRSDGDLRRLIGTVPQLSSQVSALIRDTDPSLGVLIANLLTTSTLALGRTDAIQELLVSAPPAIAAGSNTVGNGIANFGLSLTFFDPLGCTAGYDGTNRRSGLDTGAGAPLNTQARCALPAASGTGVRGAQNAPNG
ncbi:MCE family protein [Kutzneria buriramensis]|uniref:Phospholipid/cholesterol/gamma-HCH transport system substrate-binding protein n=1 Tax=Kutzneria buriramensis TaxID=1045776 RepID=A0A3E0GUQ8_9PSEU|nr:MlaD family protein [Kutzneria buriramensis]REH26460.1 phospholipid/cholesterol/gamma-HCH transport system substrate-binding protein [Kutzneria buriramensis]